MIIEMFYGVLMIMIEFSSEDVHHHNIKLNQLSSLNFSQSKIIFTYKESGKQEVINVFSDQDYKEFVDWWIKNKYQVVEEMATTDTKYVESSNRQLNY